MNRVSKIVFLLLIISCSKEEPGGDGLPSIQYVGIEKIKNPSGKDTALTVTFTFKDSDGDLGFREEDTIPPYSLPENLNNMIVEFKGIENAQEVYYRLLPGNTDTFNYNQRMQSLTPTGKYKSISGKMELKVEFGFLPILIGTLPDSIKLNISIIDRKFNRSNIISTPVIPLDF